MTFPRFIPAVLLLACLALSSIGQDRTQPERRISGLVEMLDDESWMVREQSTAMLGDPNEGFELSMLAEALQRVDLNPEQRMRLHIASRALFNQLPKAGLGVGFGAIRDGGVEIGTVVADVERFPAAGILKPGDLIVGGDGQALVSSDDLRSLILSHEPGETLNLLVQRGVDVLDLDLPLGSYKLLTGAAPIGRAIADRAIEIRWARRGIAIPDTNRIGEGISPEDWVRAGYPEEPGSFRASNARRSPKIVHSGSNRDVYVGVGVINQGRVEPWSNKDAAQIAVDQARRIELSKSIHIARLRVKLLSGGIETLIEQSMNDPGDSGINSKLTEATKQLDQTRAELDEMEAEFELLAPKADPKKPVPHSD